MLLCCKNYPFILHPFAHLHACLLQQTDLLQHIDASSEDLGRRGIDDEDAKFHRKSKRFSFRKNVIPSNSDNNTVVSEKESRDAPNIFSPKSEKRDLAAAFRILAATRSPDKEGDNFGAAAVRDDASVSAFSAAKAIEMRVVELIRTIGEIVVNMEQPQTPASRSSGRSTPHVRSDPVFEYFCEKSILSLFVDIAKEVRQGSETRWAESSFHGVVWSPLVKAQVFQTASLIISDVRNHSVLYYLLSHNYVNELIECMLPLQQWTDPALSKMMPAYVDLLKNVTVQLADDPHLFPFLTVEDPTKEKITKFPLFSAALETATSLFAQSEYQIYGTSLGVAVNIMQILHPPIQTWVCNAGWEQRRLADHLCQRLLDRYFRIANLTTGPVLDGVRSNAISGQLRALKDHMGMIHEVFWSGVKGLDVRLCESLLQRVVTVLLKHLLPAEKRRFLVVGVVDGDVIPEREALAQVSTIFLTYLFSTLTYVPFQRMLAVALLHERSTPLWSSLLQRDRHFDTSSESYVFMPALSDIVTGEESRGTCPNLFRSELLKGLTGHYGEWRTIACACLLQSALDSEAMDDESLQVLNIVPDFDKAEYRATALEESIVTFLERHHQPSPVTLQALESVGYLAIQVIHRTVMKFTQDGKDVEERVGFVLLNSPVWKAVLKALRFFALEAQKCQKMSGVSDIFLDLIEAAVSTRYTTRFNEAGSASFICLLSQRGRANSSVDSEILIRQLRGVSSNDVETSRFFINMTLHYRALCKVVDRLCCNIKKESRGPTVSDKSQRKVDLDLVDEADELTRIIGGLSEKPTVGTDLDLTGRMTFRFQSAIKSAETQGSTKLDSAERAQARLRNLSEEMGVFRSSSHLMLVLDPTDMFVVKPMTAKMEENRGTVLCSISLRSVIAAAGDGEWLHAAVRNEDVGFLIKNGTYENVDHHDDR
jgi:hypothetical protein